MTLTTPAPDTADPVDEVRAWLEENWDPALTLAEWWERLGLAGWAAPILPAGSYGRGLSRRDALLVARAIAGSGAPGAPVGLGLALAAPTITTHGTPEQIERYVQDIVTGKRSWCQLFSEPGAGSDLAGLATRAERDGDVWVVNGQKVWTSGGHLADIGMLIARTDPTRPKHQGITWFAIDMHQPGVEIRPLKQMTGDASFSEVFFTDAVVADEARIGDLHDGWKVANTTLAYERAGMGAGGGGQARGPVARAGTVAGDLNRPASEFVPPAPGPEADEETPRRSPAQLYIDLARRLDRDTDPALRQRLAQAHILSEIRRMTTERNKAARVAGGEIPGVGNFSKLLMADILRLHRDLGMELLGPRGMLHAYEGADRKMLDAATGPDPAAHAVTGQALQAQAMPIFGGTDEVQRNIIGERVLGLPKEPGDLSHRPFNEIPRNG